MNEWMNEWEKLYILYYIQCVGVFSSIIKNLTQYVDYIMLEYIMFICIYTPAWTK